MVAQRNSLNTAVVLACVLAISSPWAACSDNAVVELSFNDFFPSLASATASLVMFYSPTCPHCIALEPEFEAAATALKLNALYRDSVLLAKVDATAEDMLAQAMNVQGYPSVYWFHGARYEMEYDGGRDAESIATFVQEMFEVASEGEELPDALPELSVGQAEEPVTPSGDDAVGEDKEEDGDNIEASGDDAESVLPPVLSFPSLTLQRIMKHEINIPDSERQVLLIYDANDANERVLTADFDKLARKHAGSAVFIAVDSEDAGALRYLKLARSSLPAARILDFTGDRESWYAAEVETLERDVASFLAGDKPTPIYEAEPLPQWVSLKSEPLNTTSSGPLVHLNGDNFYDQVIEPSQDIAVLVFAEWCHHCQTVMPVYSGLAEKLKNVPTLVLAQMDGDKNDVHGLKVEGFPTLFLFPALEKKAVVYEGATWGEDDLVDFLQQQVSIKFSSAGASLGTSDGKENVVDTHAEL